jgi:hypothetical protein
LPEAAGRARVVSTECIKDDCNRGGWIIAITEGGTKGRLCGVGGEEGAFGSCVERGAVCGTAVCVKDACMKGDWIAGVPGGGTTGALSTGCGFESCADGGAACGKDVCGGAVGDKDVWMKGD